MSETIEIPGMTGEARELAKGVSEHVRGALQEASEAALGPDSVIEASMTKDEVLVAFLFLLADAIERRAYKLDEQNHYKRTNPDRAPLRTDAPASDEAG